MPPSDWICRESTRRKGRMYYYNTKTGNTQWEKPDDFDNDLGGLQPTKESPRSAKFQSPKKQPRISGGSRSPNNKNTPKSQEPAWWTKKRTTSVNGSSTPSMLGKYTSPSNNKSTPKSAEPPWWNEKPTTSMNRLSTPSKNTPNKSPMKPRRSNLKISEQSKTSEFSPLHSSNRSVCRFSWNLSGFVNFPKYLLMSVKRGKPRTPAQDRLQKLVPKLVGISDGDENSVSSQSEASKCTI